MDEKFHHPEVQCIFGITNPGIQLMFEQYRSCLTEKDVESYFYNTTLVCNIAHNQVLCQAASCDIANEGFSVEYLHDESFQRDVKGFHLTPDSSRRNSSTRSLIRTECRAVILCDICPGQKYMPKETEHHLLGPPLGFHSIYRQLEKDGLLDIVIYNSAAVMVE